MLNEIESYVYQTFIEQNIIYIGEEKLIAKDYIDSLKLTAPEKNFLMYIINKHKINVTEKIKKEDRSPYVRDDNYGEIQTYEMQKLDEPVMSQIEYSPTTDKIAEDYTELDNYLETRFIPNYVLMKKRKNDNGEIIYFPSIRLHHITALKLSEAEFEHVMNYLKEKNIRVGGKSAALESEFENYDYITTYKSSALPTSVPSNVTLEKIRLYKETGNKKIRDEIIVDNMRLVPYVAYRYAATSKIDENELESYGYEGLIIALEKFDLSYGCTFSTYAVAFIRGHILNGISEIYQGSKNQLYYDYVNAKIAVEKETGLTLVEDPSLIEDVIELLVNTGKIKGTKESIAYARKNITYFAIGNASLDDPEMEEEIMASGALTDATDYEAELMNYLSKESLEKVLNTLPPREEKIIRLSFGIDDGLPKTLNEIADIYGVSKERIRQMIARALRQLRRANRAKYIKEFAEDTETQKFSK